MKLKNLKPLMGGISFTLAIYYLCSSLLGWFIESVKFPNFNLVLFFEFIYSLMCIFTGLAYSVAVLNADKQTLFEVALLTPFCFYFPHFTSYFLYYGISFSKYAGFKDVFIPNLLSMSVSILGGILSIFLFQAFKISSLISQTNISDVEKQ